MMQKSWRRWLWVCVGVVLVMLAVAPFVHKRVLWWYILRTSPEVLEVVVGRALADVDEMCDLTGLTFPTGSKLVNSRLYIFLGCTLHAKVELPRHEVEDFLRSLPSPSEMSTADRLGISPQADDPAWWRPASARRFVALRVSNMTQDYQRTIRGEWRSEGLNILVDLDDSRFASVYIQWSAE